MKFGLDDLKSIAQTFYNAGKMKEYQAILEAQQKIFDLQEENANLKEANRNFKALDKFEKSLVYDKNAYYSIDKAGQKEGPFCSKCWDDKRKKLRMQKIRRYNVCPNCNTCADL